MCLVWVGGDDDGVCGGDGDNDVIVVMVKLWC